MRSTICGFVIHFNWESKIVPQGGGPVHGRGEKDDIDILYWETQAITLLLWIP